MINIKSKKMKPCSHFLEQRQERKDKIFGPLSLFILPFLHSYSIKNYGPHWFISFICTWPFDQYIWCSFIYSFFCAQPFDQNIWSSFIYSFLQTTIQPKYMVLFDLFLLFTYDKFDHGPLSFILFLLHNHSTKNYGPHLFIFFIWNDYSTKIYDLHSFLLITHDHSTNIYGLLSFIFSFANDHLTKIYGPLSFILPFTNDHSTKIYGPLSFILSFTNDHSTKMYGPLSYILPLCTIIRPKIRVLINLSFLFVHDYSTKIRVRSYSLICSFLNCANISYAIFMAALPLYFVRYISWFMSVLPLHLVRYIHGYMKS